MRVYTEQKDVPRQYAQKMSHRRLSREIALQILYSLDAPRAEESTENTIGNYLSMLKSLEPEEKAEMGIKGDIAPAVKDFIIQLVAGTWQNISQIDSIIAKQVANWNFDRLTKTDKAILRLACFEMMLCDDIPLNVGINEAIELAKIYGEENSPAFVNGVLDGIAATIRSNVHP